MVLRLGKSMAETSSTDLVRSRRWTAFSYVRFLRVRSSGLRLPTRKPTGNLKTIIELGPKLRSTEVIEASKPVRMALTPMMVPVPIITPSTVRKARSLCDRMVSSARVRPLRNASFVIRDSIWWRRRSACESRFSYSVSSFHPQGLNRIQHGRAARRIDAEEQAHHRRKPDAG